MTMAIPVKRGMWSTIKLADGSEVKVERVGDEHGSWLCAANGTCYVKDATGLYVQADAEELCAKRLARYNQRRAKRRAIYASTSDGLGKKGYDEQRGCAKYRQLFHSSGNGPIL